MKLDLRKFAPPGLELKSEGWVMAGGLAATLFYSCSFLIRFFDEYGQLYRWNSNGERVWIDGAVMPDFVVLLDRALLGFLIMAAVMLTMIVAHYGYHHQGSKSIYLMRRLPDRWELHRRCITLPVLAAALCLILGAILLLLYFALYMYVTPEHCLTPYQWQKIWRELL